MKTEHTFYGTQSVAKHARSTLMSFCENVASDTFFSISLACIKESTVVFDGLTTEKC